MYNQSQSNANLIPSPTDGSYRALREGCSPGLAEATCDCNHTCSVGPPPRGQSAARFIVEQIHQAVKDDKGPVVVVGCHAVFCCCLPAVRLGPFTNTALAKQLDPSIVVKAHLWLMAGGFNSAPHDNEHADVPRHETNTWCVWSFWWLTQTGRFDPSASRSMLRADLYSRNWATVTMVPTDVG